jgi:hypothetical protein
MDEHSQTTATKVAQPWGWPKPMGKAALYGLLGDIVRCIGPHTEADPAALLLQNLATFGNVIGRKPHFKVGADYHAGNLFVLIVGRSARARKGTSSGYVRQIFEAVDPEWSRTYVHYGLSTGEGLVQAATELKDTFAKRLLILEDEFSRVLRVMARETSILSTVARQLWDGRPLEVMTRKAPLRAENVHVSIIGHTTQDDLKRYLSKTEIFNGFGNRFLWGCMNRSQLLPEGGELPTEEFRELIERMKSAVAFAKGLSEVKFSAKARELWAKVYPELSGDVPGVVGAVTSRAEAQVRRVAMLYALLDESEKVLRQHLLAALEVWRFCRDSARYIFSDSTEQGAIEKLLGILPTTGVGIARTGISKAFSNHHSKEIADALKYLESSGLAKPTVVTGGGRPGEYWVRLDPDGTKHAK